MSKAKKTAKNTNATRNVIPGDAKIKWAVGAKNPFREGSGAFKRTEIVRKGGCRTRDAIEKNENILWTTVPNLVRLGVVLASE